MHRPKDKKKQEIPQDYESLSHYFVKPMHSDIDHRIREDLMDMYEDPTGTRIW